MMQDAATSQSEIEAAIYGYLDKRFPAMAPAVPDTPLLTGAVDSLGFLELIMFLGERFGIAMEDDIDFQALATPADLVSFVARGRA